MPLALRAGMRLTRAITGALITSLVAQAANAASTLRIYPLDGSTGAVGAASDTADWDSTVAGFTFSQAYVRDGQAFVVLLKRQKGELSIYELDAGNIGARTSHYFLGRTYSAAEIVYENNLPDLVLHDEDDGALHRYVLDADGSLGTSSSMSGSVWRGRATFGAYAAGGNAYYLGHNPWTGSTIVYREDGTPISDSAWTLGFTEVDNTSFGGKHYQLLYKHNDEPGNQGGRLHIREISANGTPIADLYNSYGMGKGWTSVELFSHATPNGRAYQAVFFYNGSTGEYRVRRLESTGLQSTTASGFIAANLTDVSFVRDGGVTYLVGVDEEGTATLSSSQIENMVDFVRGSSMASMPGYQLVIMQNGKIVHRHASGLAVISTGTAMTNDTRLDIGSVSKTVLSVTMSRLEEWDEVELDGHITDYVDYSGQGFSADPSQVVSANKAITLRDMFYHSTGWNGGSHCSVADINSDLSCMTRLYTTPEGGACAAAGNCAYNYDNYNYSMMRHAVELVTNQHDTADMVEFADQTWMDRIGLGGMSCLAQAGNSALYGCPTDFNGDGNLDGNDCIAQQGSWVEFPSADSPGCAGGGWKATSIEMAKFMRGIRYRQSVGEHMAQEILTNVLNGNGNWVGVGWNSMSWTSNAGERPLGKVGSVPNRYYAALMHVNERNVTLVLMTNADVNTLGILRNAWDGQ
jgi:CubicO group peptidase (beta-lactamase class C family)